MRSKSVLLVVTSPLLLLLVLLGLLASQQPVHATAASSTTLGEITVITRTVLLTPSKDNTLYEDNSGTTSNGMGAFFFVGKTNNDRIRRGLIAFDVAGQVPAGATVVSATLQLEMTKSRGSGATVSLHRLLADWGEGTSDASANEGQGAAATTGDATWLHRTFSDTLWLTPGGDFTTTVSAATAVGSVGFYQWSSSPTMITDVQHWLDEPTSNFGWAVIGDESGPQTAQRFTARESSSATNQPQLTVVYTVTGTAQSALYLPIVQK